MPIFFQDNRSNTFNITWYPVPEIFSYGDTGQFSSWSFGSGANLTIKRFANCRPNPLRPTWGELDIVLTTSGGVHTLSLQLDGVELATGSRTGDGSITFAATTDIPLAGSVTLTYSADIASGASVAVRFPASYKIHYKTTPFTAPDFPRTAEGTVVDYSLQPNNLFKYSSAALAQPTYYVVVHQVDDAGNEGTGIQGGGTVVSLATAPGAPGTPVYASGGAAATIINFTASTTVGATYNIYDSLDTGILNMTTVNHTHIAGTGTIADTLTAISGTFTGNRFIVVRSLNGGVEDGNNNALTIEYVSGVVVPPRPPTPYANGNILVSGLSVTIPYAYQNAGSFSTPTTIFCELNSASDFSGFSYTATQAVDTVIGNTVTGSILNTVLFSGPWWYRLKTYNATADSLWSDTYGPIQLETVVPTDPSSIVVTEGV